MAQINGVVLSVSLSTSVAKQSGGTYEAWELVYKTDSGEVRSFQKPVQGLKFNPNLKGQLAALVPGDAFVAVTEKNAGGFVEVKSVEKGSAVASSVPPQRQPSTPATNNYQGRDYESKEERTKKQELIVRQSSVSNAIQLLSIGAKTAPKVDEVLSVAQQVFDFVYGNDKKPASVEITEIDDDIPY